MKTEQVILTEAGNYQRAANRLRELWQERDKLSQALGILGDKIREVEFEVEHKHLKQLKAAIIQGDPLP